MQHVFRHGLDPKLARRAAERAFASYCERYAKYEPRVLWDGRHARCSFRAKGVRVSANVELGREDVTVDVEVPWLLRPFRALALARIERELQLWCQRARQGELEQPKTDP